MNPDVETLKKDLCVLRDDIELILKKKHLIEDQEFVKKIAHDIKKVDQDSYFLRSYEDANLVHYFLSTPMGAPFVSACTLLEAAIMCKKQYPLSSSLHTFLHDLVQHTDKNDVPLLLWVENIMQKLH